MSVYRTIGPLVVFTERKSITGRKKDYWDYLCNCIESVKGVNDGIKYVKTVGDVRIVC